MTFRVRIKLAVQSKRKKAVNHNTVTQMLSTSIGALNESNGY